MNKEEIDILSFIKVSKHRAKILKILKENPEIPTIIGSEIGMSTTHVSKYLKGLKEKGLVECLNEDAKVGRLYQLTPKGLKFLKMIK